MQAYLLIIAWGTPAQVEEAQGTPAQGTPAQVEEAQVEEAQGTPAQGTPVNAVAYIPARRTPYWPPRL